MRQRLNATSSNVPAAAPGGALLTKYFTSERPSA